MAIPVAKDLLPPYLRQSTEVIYSEGNRHGSLYWLNFCHFCKQLRDQKSMCVEVELKRCTHCQETSTIAESIERETGCAQCFECPICSQTLVVRTTMVAAQESPKEGDDSSSEKRYHLLCQTCRWSSRSAGIPDFTRPPSLLVPWKFVQEGVKDSRDSITSLSDYYHGLCVNERGESLMKTKEKHQHYNRTRTRLGQSPLFTDKFKLVSVAQKRISSGVTGGGGPAPDMVILEAKAPKAHFHENLEEDEELWDFSTKKWAQDKLSLQQRLNFPAEQPKFAVNLHPRRKPLTTKVAWRCKLCQHVLVKKEFGGPAQHIKFKMISAAPLFVPNIKPCQTKLVLGEVCDFIVTISNPLNHPVNMTFSLPSPDDPVPNWIDGQVVDQLKVPESAVILLNRNCAAGVDERGKEAVTSLADDDPKVIAFRRLYTIGLKFSCVPISADCDNWASFNIRYDFHENQSTVFDPEKSSQPSSKGDQTTAVATTSGQSSWIYLRIDMNLGKGHAKSG